MSYTTIKIPVETHRKLKSLSLLTMISQQDLLNKCLLDFEANLFWEKCESAYAKNNTIGNIDELLYSNTLSDGIEDEY